MGAGRLEAFTEGVMAMALTIMVLGFRPPGEASWAALSGQWPVAFSYMLSFVYVGIYWNNHHHMLRAPAHIDGRVLWVNLHLLFWVTLIPFATAWMSGHRFDAAPVTVYGVVLLMAALAFIALQPAILVCSDRDSSLSRAIGRDAKGKASLLLYPVAIILAA